MLSQSGCTKRLIYVAHDLVHFVHQGDVTASHVPSQADKYNCTSVELYDDRALRPPRLPIQYGWSTLTTRSILRIRSVKRLQPQWEKVGDMTRKKRGLHV
jgi:hypothetical protein